MRTPSLTAAQRAGALLAAWQRKDLTAFEALLSRIRLEFAGRSAMNHQEDERMELLDGIARQMRQDIFSTQPVADADQHAELCLRMLRHLAGERPPAIRFERPSSSPC